MVQDVLYADFMETDGFLIKWIRGKILKNLGQVNSTHSVSVPINVQSQIQQDY